MNRLKALLSGSALGLACLLPCIALAAGEDTPAQAGAASLGDVIVTARKVSENAQRIPVAVTALSGQAVTSRNIVRLNDLSAVAPNVYIFTATNDPTGAEISIRGLRQPDTLATIDPAVGMYFDGIYLPRLGGAQYLLRNPNEIGQLEILNGPQGTLFGRNTTGGALIVNSLSPARTLQAYGDVTVGNYGMVQATVGLNVPFSIGGVRMSYAHGHQNGFTADSAGNPEGSEDFDRFSARILLHPTDRLSIDLTSSNIYIKHGTDIWKLHSLAVPGYNVPGTAKTSAVLEIQAAQAKLGNNISYNAAADILQSYTTGGIFVNGASYDLPFTDRLFVEGATITANLTDQLTLKSITGYVHSYRNGYKDNDGTPYPTLDGHNFQTSTQWSEELQLLGRFGPVDGVLGGYISHETGSELSWVKAVADTGLSPGFAYDGEVTNISRAVFGQANWHITHALTFTGGLRYTQDTKELVSLNYTSTALNVNNTYPLPPGTVIPLPAAPGYACQIQASLLTSPSACQANLRNTYSSLSWLASLDYKITDTILAYAKASRGFRSGGQNLRGNTSTGFLPFQPENVTQYEVGLKSTLFENRLRLNLDAYYSDYTNIDENVFVVLNGVGTTTVINAAKATIDGVEVSATWAPVDHLTLFVTYGLVHGKFKTYLNGNVDHSSDPWPSPPNTLDVGGSYTVPLSFGALTVNGDWNWQSRQFLYGDETQPWCATSQIGVTPGCVQYSLDRTLDVYGPAQGIVNLRATLHIDAWNADLSFWARNLLNSEYLVWVQDAATAAGAACSGTPSTCTINPNAKFGNGYRLGTYTNPRTFGFELRVKVG